MKEDRRFTLVELILVVVVVGIAMPPLALMFYEGMQRSVDTNLTSTAAQLANSMMEEIKTRKWDEKTPDEGGKAAEPYSAIGTDGPPSETRPTYNDIDDYDAISNQSPPRDALDQPLPEFSGYTRSVEVKYVECIGEAFVTAGETSEHKQVIVTVSCAAGSVSLVTVFSNY